MRTLVVGQTVKFRAAAACGLALLLSHFALTAPPAAAAETIVRTREALVRAVATARPGDVIKIAPGRYNGGLFFSNLKGTTEKPIVVTAFDAARPPTIEGGSVGIQLTNGSYVHLENLIITGSSVNGLNIDDGGDFTTPATGIVLRKLTITRIGTRGNNDGMKLSGLKDFRIEHCTVDGWGGGGSGIDMVGCHDGVVEDSTFRNNTYENGNGVQTKGGSSNVVIRRCFFDSAGERAVNVGGSTGSAYFRPKGAPHEASNITVEHCKFVGSRAAVAFVGVDGAVMRVNTIYRPKRWALRILQEHRAEELVPCRGGVITDNIFVFRSDEMAIACNVGGGTAPDTFKFARNWWYCEDHPARSTPQLPTREQDGVYGKDPQLIPPTTGSTDLTLRPTTPAKSFGADAEPPTKPADNKK